MICCMPSATARRPEPQTWLMPQAALSFGQPALPCAWRAGFWPCRRSGPGPGSPRPDLRLVHAGALERRLDDITRSVLTQIIFEQENKGQNLLPITFLRQLIRFYGDSMQNVVPSYLDFSMTSLTKEQDRLREQMSSAFGATAFDAIEDQVKRNAEVFDRAMKMFLPFGQERDGEAGAADGAATGEGASRTRNVEDFDALKKQLDAMQKKIDALAGGDKE
jgi:polyhydroxyalkanoate synthesis regulator protein